MVMWSYSHNTIATGAQAALSLNSAGLGFISYLQEEDYELPDLKIAWQQYVIFLPSQRLSFPVLWEFP